MSDRLGRAAAHPAGLPPPRPGRRRSRGATQENPGYTWHTLGGHIDGSPAFWDTIGADVPGGYRPRRVCEHVTAGG
ncbi:hypothetical protein GCM10029963_79260 [Micromonospora andamanensis]